jgi:ComF family protein
MFAQSPNKNRLLSQPLRGVLDFLLPHMCVSCRNTEIIEPGLCPACWPKLNFISAPQCACCGLPFPFDLGPNGLCVDCLDARPYYALARAALRYDDASRPLILAFKHGDKTHLRLLLGKWLRLNAWPILQGADYIVPIPLHWTRLLRRKYNQAALLADELSQSCGVAHAPFLLRRQKRTLPHVAMSRKERQRNLRGAFRVPARYLPAVVGKIIVLVDDVYTTGSTFAEASNALLAAGAKEVRALALARVCNDI